MNERTTRLIIGSPSNPSTTRAVTRVGTRSRPARQGCSVVSSPRSRNACSARVRARAATSSAATTTTSCTIDKAAAAGRSSNWVVWYQISVSMVPKPTPPITITMPNAVAQNRKTSDAPDSTAGAMAGSVTVQNTRTGDAPSTRAASSARGSSRDHRAPTVRTITE